MTAEDAVYCRERCRTITVNSTWQMAPAADVHYSSDIEWWDANVCAPMYGEKWTGCPRAADQWGLRLCRFERKPGISFKPGVIHWGGNSGYCAVGLAVQFGARKIVLLGFDMDGTHWHDDHPDGVKKPPAFGMWIDNFRTAAADLRFAGIEVVNASRQSMLDCFPRLPLEKCL